MVDSGAENKFSNILFDLKNLPLRHFSFDEVNQNLDVTQEGLRGDCMDLSALEFFLESFVSYSALKINVNSKYILPPWYLKDIQSTYGDRINISQNESPLTKALAYLSPISQELGVTFDGAMYWRKKPEKDKLLEKAFSFYQEVCTFFIAFEEDLQCQLDLHRINSSITFLKKHLCTSESRFKLAQLEAIFSSYDIIEVPAILSRSTHSNEMVEVFLEIVKNDKYVELSRQLLIARKLQKRSQAFSKADKLVKDILNAKLFKGILNYGVKCASMLCSMPTLDISTFWKEKREKAFPTIIQFGNVMEEAILNWAIHGEKFIPYLCAHGSSFFKNDGGKKTILSSEAIIKKERKFIIKEVSRELKEKGAFKVMLESDNPDYEVMVRELRGYIEGGKNKSTELLIY